MPETHNPHQEYLESQLWGCGLTPAETQRKQGQIERFEALANSALDPAIAENREQILAAATTAASVVLVLDEWVEGKHSYHKQFSEPLDHLLEALNLGELTAEESSQIIVESTQGNITAQTVMNMELVKDDPRAAVISAYKQILFAMEREEKIQRNDWEQAEYLNNAAITHGFQLTALAVAIASGEFYQYDHEYSLEASKLQRLCVDELAYNIDALKPDATNYFLVSKQIDKALRMDTINTAWAIFDRDPEFLSIPGNFVYKLTQKFYQTNIK